MSITLLENLGYIASFVSAIAVVASLIYLGQQVRQSNRLARLSAIDALRDATNRFREILLENNDNLDVWLRGIQDWESLTDAERYRWDELALYLWDSTQATYLRAVELGESFTVQRIAYTVRFASGGKRFKGWWEQRRERFHPDFVRFVDAQIGQPPGSLSAQS